MSQIGPLCRRYQKEQGDENYFSVVLRESHTITFYFNFNIMQNFDNMWKDKIWNGAT